MEIEQQIREKFEALSGYLSEAGLRIWVAAEAKVLGRGGISAVARATGISRTTIYSGLADLSSTELRRPRQQPGRVRAKGGGRKKRVEKDLSLLADLEALVEPASRGDPMSPLRWTCKSTPRLAKELQAQGHSVCQRTVCRLLDQLGYSLQSTRKTREGGKHPDRDAQFRYIAGKVAEYQKAGDPVVSVDTKKKELVGDFKNAGQEWHPKGEPEEGVPPASRPFYTVGSPFLG